MEFKKQKGMGRSVCGVKIKSMGMLVKILRKKVVNGKWYLGYGIGVMVAVLYGNLVYSVGSGRTDSPWGKGGRGRGVGWYQAE